MPRPRVWEVEHELDFRPHLPINSTHLYSSHPVQLFTDTLIIGAYLIGDLHVYDYYLAYSTIDLWKTQVWTSQVHLYINVFSKYTISPPISSGFACTDSTDCRLKTVFWIYGWESVHAKSQLKLYVGFWLHPNPHVIQGKTIICIKVWIVQKSLPHYTLCEGTMLNHPAKCFQYLARTVTQTHLHHNSYYLLRPY